MTNTGFQPLLPHTVSTADLAAEWPGAAVVDVRSAEEYGIAHVPGSVNVPLDELPVRLNDVPNGTVYLLCGSGKRSAQAAALLAARGYDVRNVAGGMTEWYRSGHPVTYSPAPAVAERPPGPWRRLVRLLSRRGPGMP